jgi:hypothetical protein
VAGIVGLASDWQVHQRVEVCIWPEDFVLKERVTMELSGLSASAPGYACFASLRSSASLPVENDTPALYSSFVRYASLVSQSSSIRYICQ